VRKAGAAALSGRIWIDLGTLAVAGDQRGARPGAARGEWECLVLASNTG
jgi:hypothetical protein